MNTIDGCQFLKTVRPALESGDCTALAQAVSARWRPKEISSLLTHVDVDVRRVAAMTLGLVGNHCVSNYLVQALHDPDEQVNQMAEHSLWTIWFRAGSCKSAKPFREGLALLNIDAYREASAKFAEAASLDPQFAEANNQCAIAHFFIGEWELSMERCNRCLDVMPNHFGAMAGLGHCYAQMDKLEIAMDCYKKALLINPRMPAISKAIGRIERRLRGENGSSGSFEGIQG